MSATVTLVTGATDGIGRQTALELARRGGEVIVHGRSQARVDATLAAIRAEVPAAVVSGSVFDLGDLAAIRTGATELLARPALHVLVNNAGVLLPRRELAASGVEMTFAVNHLGHYLLTRLLLPLLERSAPARVVHVSSMVHGNGRIRLDDLTYASGYDGVEAYADSKLANILFSRALAKRLDPAKVTSNSLHPGVIATKLLRQGWGAGGGKLERGARTSVLLALDPALTGVTNRYFADEREARVSRDAQDDTLAEALWRRSAELVGLPA